MHIVRHAKGQLLGGTDLAGNGGVVRSNNDQIGRDGKTLRLDVDTCKAQLGCQHITCTPHQSVRYAQDATPSGRSSLVPKRQSSAIDSNDMGCIFMMAAACTK